jgi:hypothetical protein
MLMDCTLHGWRVLHADVAWKGMTVRGAGRRGVGVRAGTALQLQEPAGDWPVEPGAAGKRNACGAAL